MNMKGQRDLDIQRAYGGAQQWKAGEETYWTGKGVQKGSWKVIDMYCSSFYIFISVVYSQLLTLTVIVIKPCIPIKSHSYFCQLSESEKNRFVF